MFLIFPYVPDMLVLLTRRRYHDMPRQRKGATTVFEYSKVSFFFRVQGPTPSIPCKPNPNNEYGHACVQICY